MTVVTGVSYLSRLSGPIRPLQVKHPRSGLLANLKEGERTVGREDELAEAYDAARPRLTRVAYSILGCHSDAEDAVSDAWLRLTCADSRERVLDVEAWGAVAVARIALDTLRSTRSRRETYVGHKKRIGMDHRPIVPGSQQPPYPPRTPDNVAAPIQQADSTSDTSGTAMERAEIGLSSPRRGRSPPRLCLKAPVRSGSRTSPYANGCSGRNLARAEPGVSTVSCGAMMFVAEPGAPWLGRRCSSCAAGTAAS
jgi:DNA-directed RNA polymerase specialized sigma24 family protein